MFFVHVAKTVAGYLGNRAARPTAYARPALGQVEEPEEPQDPGFEHDDSRPARSSLLFVVTHLATFKFGAYYEAPDGIRDLVQGPAGGRRG